MEEQKTNFPKWLTPEFFNDIFEKKLDLPKNKFKLCIRSIEPFGGAGENYTSKLYRAQIEAKNDDTIFGKLSVFVKALMTMPELKHFSVFPNEAIAYNTILPAVEDIWLQNAKKYLKFGPECYKIYSEGEDEVIVLEDISADNAYQVFDRYKGLNLEHSKMALKLLAQYHAASATHLQLYGMIDGVKIGYFQPEKKPIFEAFIQTTHRSYLDVVNSWSFGQKYIEKLRKMNKILIDFFETISKYDPQKFNVLAHGDMWLNNILFSKNYEGEVKEIRFIDFQHGYYGTPALDLYNFLLTSVSMEFKVDKFDELVKYYYDCLVECLETLKYPKTIPTFDGFLKEIETAKLMAQMVCLGPLPIVLAPKNENSSMQLFMENTEYAENFRKSVFNNPIYVTQMEKLLPFLDSKGMLEV